MVKFVRKYHKVLMALVGLQFLIWSATGVYMVAMDIHHIHGESLQLEDKQVLDLSRVVYSTNQLLTDFPNATSIELVRRMDRQVYRFGNEAGDKVVVDAETGHVLPAVDETLAKQLARYSFHEEADIASTRLIHSLTDSPSELAARHLPVWQVTFDKVTQPTFYISQQTGAIVTKRHTYWRLFDWMWRFHIMDYDDGENVSNWFLLLISLLGCAAVLAGAVLTYYRVVQPKQAESA